MRSLVSMGLFLTVVAMSIGCVLPIYSSSPDERAKELIFTSEDLRQSGEIWQRMWFLDMPDTATPYRTHGGVI